MAKKWIDTVWNERTQIENQRDGDTRKPFERDPDRIIYSSAFRRLQAKTQVLGVGEGDFHRTRLTHSVEVSQLGLGILRALNRNKNIPQKIKDALPTHWNITAICLAHDLGHPPYGHGGEIALNNKMKDFGGFEGNAQTLRILTKLESHHYNSGLNLTRRTLLGVMKYPIKYSVAQNKMKIVDERSKTLKLISKSANWDLFKPPKCYYDTEEEIVDWILFPFIKSDRSYFTEIEKPPKGNIAKPKGRSLDSSIMELADDIAYGIHDLEDMISLELIDKDCFKKVVYDKKWAVIHGLPCDCDELVNELFSKKAEKWKRREAIAKIINAIMTSIEIKEDLRFNHDLLRYNVSLSIEAKDLLQSLQDVVYNHVIKSDLVQMADYKGMHIISNLFDSIISNPKRTLKDNFYDQYKTSNTDYEKVRVICDFIAGMTDGYAAKYYERLFVPHEGSVFERL